MGGYSCTVLPYTARKDTQMKQSADPQAIRELYTKLAMPREPHKLSASLAGNWRLPMTSLQAPLS